MHWLQFGNISLYSNDKEDVVDGQWLTDLHMNAVQYMLKSQFPYVSGLHSTLICKSGPAEIQILFVNNNHWITVSTKCDGADVIVYD